MVVPRIWCWNSGGKDSAVVTAEASGKLRVTQWGMGPGPGAGNPGWAKTRPQNSTWQNRPLRGGPPEFDDELGLLRVGRPRRGGPTSGAPFLLPIATVKPDDVAAEQTGPSKGQRPLGSECCVTSGDSGREGYTAIAWGVGLSHERSDIAGAECFYSPEGNMCGTATRGAVALPGSVATSRAKGSHRKLGGLVSGRFVCVGAPHREGEEP